VRRSLSPLAALLAAVALPGCAGLSFGPDRTQRMIDAQRAREAAAEETPRVPPRTVEERLAEAQRLLAQGREGQALWSYVEAHRMDPSDPAPRARIGYFEVSRDPERAESIFASLVADHPDSAQAHAGLGLARFAQSRLDEARVSLERAVELDPGSSSSLYWLAVVYDLLDREDAAREHVERAYALSPKDAHIVNGLGVSYLKAGDYPQAEQAFRSAILLDPSDPALHNNLGLALGHQRRYDEALAEFLRGGSEQAAHNNLGYVYYLNGVPERAVEHYELSLKAGGDDRLTVIRNLNAALDAMQETRR
jgi:Flp pilus assembly protein TadD